MRKLLKAVGSMLLVAVIIVFGWLKYTSNKGGAIVERCRHLELGMTKPDVIAIMGPADKELPASKVGAQSARLELIWDVPAAFSTFPEVSLDVKTGKVVSVVCGEAVGDRKLSAGSKP